MDPGIELEDEEGAGAEPFHHLDDLLVEALKNRSDSYDRRGSDQHAQDGQESAEFVAAQRVQRQQKIFANRLASLRHT